MSSPSATFLPRDAPTSPTPARPSTRLAKPNIQRQYDRDTLGINWISVAIQEPDQVSTWIVYLHRRKEDAAVLALLQAIGKLFIEHVVIPGCKQWLVYQATDVPGVLMEIASEHDMFSLDEATYKVRYCPGRRYSFARMTNLFKRT